MATSCPTAWCAPSGAEIGAPRAVLRLSRTGNEISGPMRQGASTGLGAPDMLSLVTASAMLSGSPSEAGTTGTESRDASSTAATAAALAASSLTSDSTMMPRPLVEMLRPLDLAWRASPASASLACKASATRGWGARCAAIVANALAAPASSAMAASARGLGLSSRGTITQLGWSGSDGGSRQSDSGSLAPCR